MVLNVVVDAIAPVITHRGDDVVDADVVVNDLEHGTAPVALKHVPHLEVQTQQGRPGVRRRHPFVAVLEGQRDRFGHLLALHIGDLDVLSGGGLEGCGVPGRDENLVTGRAQR